MMMFRVLLDMEYMTFRAWSNLTSKISIFKIMRELLRLWEKNGNGGGQKMKCHLTRLIRYVGKRMVEVGWGLADYGYPKVIQDSGWGETSNTLGGRTYFWDSEWYWAEPPNFPVDNSPMGDKGT